MSLEKFVKLRNGNKDDKSKEQLEGSIQNRIKTTFIGSIASFEERFGKLWGHNKKDSERTESEREMYSLWMETRNEILNKGNNQIRNASKDLDNYSVKFNMYRMEMRIKTDE